MKKFKLAATIASLCLALAIMAFGVYAAVIDTFEVYGNVTFEATCKDRSDRVPHHPEVHPVQLRLLCL